MQTLLVQKAQVMHSYLAENIRPDNPVLANLPDMMSPDRPGGAALLNGFITRQAMMIAYLDNFYLLGLAAIASAPLALLIRSSKKNAKVEIHVE